MAWVRPLPSAEADGAIRRLLDYRSDVSRAAGGLDVETEDCVLEAEERDRVVIDRCTRGKRRRP